MRSFLAISAIVAVLLAADAGHAAPLEHARSREALPAREVERDLLLPRGWSGLTAGYSSRLGGRRVLRGADLELAHGLSGRVQGWLALHHREHGSRAELAGDLRTQGLASPDLGLAISLVELEPSSTALALGLEYRAPLGQGHPNPDIGPPIGAATPELRADLRLRQRWGALRVDGRTGLVAQLPAVTGLGRLPPDCADPWETQVAWMGPAAGGEAGLSALLQAGPLWVDGAVKGAVWQGRRLAADRPGDLQCINDIVLGQQIDRGGWAVDSELGVAFQASRGLQLRGWWGRDLAGRNRPDRLVDHGAGATLGGTVSVAF